MSTHSVNIVEIGEVRPHENADRLEIVPVNGWQAVVKKGQFRPGDRAIYIEPDYTVPTDRPEFAFLAKEGRDRHRLKAVRLRGVLSYGLLIPVPESLGDQSVGADVMETLGVQRYVRPMGQLKLLASDALPEGDWPKVFAPKFDVENLQRYPHVIEAGEAVIVTEKVDGGNARFVWHNGQLYLGSRSQWLKNDGQHIWKRALDATPQIAEWCQAFPDTILFGEAYGWVQSLRYGAAQGEVRFAGFAALCRDNWLDLKFLHSSFAQYGVPTAPMLYEGPYDEAAIKALAEQDSQLAPAGHMMEGVVIVTAEERRHPEIGRVALKYIPNRFWESEA